MYRVNKCFSRSELPAGQFKTQQEAEQFIQTQLADDLLYKVQATYRLYEGMDLVREFLQTDIKQTPDTSRDKASSSQGSGYSSSFKPTPFNAAPRPPGVPHSWISDDDKKKK